MDRERIKGAVQKTTGKIKEKTGEMIGDRHLKDEGRAEKNEGHLRSGVGKVKDAVRDVLKTGK